MGKGIDDTELPSTWFFYNSWSLCFATFESGLVVLNLTIGTIEFINLMDINMDNLNYWSQELLRPCKLQTLVFRRIMSRNSVCVACLFYTKKCAVKLLIKTCLTECIILPLNQQVPLNGTNQVSFSPFFQDFSYQWRPLPCLLCVLPSWVIVCID